MPGNVDVRPGAVIVEADLYRRRLVVQPCFDNAQHPVDAAHAIAADRGIEGETGPPGAAQQFVDRLIEQLALQSGGVLRDGMPLRAPHSTFTKPEPSSSWGRSLHVDNLIRLDPNDGAKTIIPDLAHRDCPG